ncbi:MAG: hypothetical protein FWB98_01980 [Defluviitaleaceae bacterium]|nr:hypothetical protein [Defluviitaleaceae bacterium]
MRGRKILTGVVLTALLMGIFAMPLHARGWNRPNPDCPRNSFEISCFEGEGNRRCSENNWRQNNNNSNRERSCGGWRR